jgi:protein disulfide-isomerase
MLSLFSVLTLAFSAFAGSIRDCHAAPDAASIGWGNDLQKALEEAAKSGFPVMIHFYSNNCVPCKMLDARAFQDPALCHEIQAKLIPVKINVDHHRDLAQRYQITRWPTDLYLHPNGQEIYRTVSPQDPAAYVKLVDRISTRNHDWITERIAKNDSPIARKSSSPQLPPSEPAHQVATQSPRFQPAAQAKIVDEVAAVPSNSNPYCVDSASQAGQDVFADQTSSPFQLAGHTRENRYQSRTSNSPIASSMLQESQTALLQSSPAQHAFVPNFGPTPAQRPLQTSDSTLVLADQADMANVVMGGVFNDAGSVDMDGYCPVSLFARSEWVLGNPSYAVKHRGRVYYCMNEEAQQAFLAAPDRFSPVLSGYDIVHFLETGELVAGKREHGCRFGVAPDRERVFLFANAATRQRFNQQAVKYAMSVGQTDDDAVSDQARVAGVGNSNLAR